MSEFKRDQEKPHDFVLDALKRSEALWKAGYAEGVKEGRKQAFKEALDLVNGYDPPKKQAG
jgi:hypothetical protein